MTDSRPPETDRPTDPWSDNLGRAGARAGQLLLIAAVAAGAVWLLLRVRVWWSRCWWR